VNELSRSRNCQPTGATVTAKETRAAMFPAICDCQRESLLFVGMNDKITEGQSELEALLRPHDDLSSAQGPELIALGAKSEPILLRWSPRRNLHSQKDLMLGLRAYRDSLKPIENIPALRSFDVKLIRALLLAEIAQHKDSSSRNRRDRPGSSSLRGKP
jgi:hypothetical protein